jgi:tripartite-type tricarboxylate transporter receptor subunit TctC
MPLPINSLRKLLKSFVHGSVAACALTLTVASAHAAWPERTVTLIVPYSAGGVTDVLARLTASGCRLRSSKP